ncbi:MAG: CinA family protein [Pseudomonadota bacterium]
MSETERLATAVLDAAAAHGIMIATAESCTGGMIAAALTDIAGSSAVVDRGFVTYSNEAKQEMLGVDPNLIDAHGAVSAEVAEAMAQGALARSQAALSVAVTGIAGPGGATQAKPVGLVYLGLADRDGSKLEGVVFPDEGRAAIRRATVDKALSMILERLANLTKTA